MLIFWNLCFIFLAKELTANSLNTCPSNTHFLSLLLRGIIPLDSLRPSIRQSGFEIDPSCPKLSIHYATELFQHQCQLNNIPTESGNETKHFNKSEEQIHDSAKNLSEPPIATFEEWTKERLSKQEKEKRKPTTIDPEKQSTDPTNTTPETIEVKEDIKVIQEQTFSVPITTTKRNYGSKECGAKVVHANPEVENKGAILNDKEKDEYMRNPCDKAQNKFLIIELCETIQPTTIELANFELFSSNPREFRVSISERYPAVEWLDVGDFVAQDTREVQSFAIIPKGAYAKFVRLELLTHYGKEHYCTLSLFRIYGISMVDEYEAEADAIIDGQPIRETTTIIREGVEMNEEVQLINEKNQTSDIPIENQESKKVAKENRQEENAPRHDIVKTVVHVVGNVFGSTIGKFLPFRLEGSNKTYVWRLSDCMMCPKKRSDSNKSFPFCLAFNFQKYQSMIFKKVSNEKEKKSMEENDVSIHKRSKGQEKFLYYIHHILFDKRSKNDSNPIEKVEKDPIIILPSEPPTPATPVKPQPVSKGTSANTDSNLSTTTAKNGNGNKIDTVGKANILQRLDPLPGIRPSHKESIFMKLNKRLTALELNISLSSEYLSELSRRYVAQTEENKKQQEKVLKITEENINEAVKQLKDEFSQQILDLQKQLNELATIMRSITSFHTTPDYTFPISVTEIPPLENCESNKDPSLLYSEDNLWTSEQLIYIVIAAQFVTMICVLLFTAAFRYLKTAKKEFSVEDIQLMIKEEINSQAEKNLKFQQENNNFDIPQLNKDIKRKKKKKKLSIMTGTSSTVEPWDSAMETSSSIPPTATPTPSELSSEMEHSNFQNENPFASQTPLASEQPLRLKFDPLPCLLKSDSPLKIEQETLPSPPWKVVLQTKVKKKSVKI